MRKISRRKFIKSLLTIGVAIPLIKPSFDFYEVLQDDIISYDADGFTINWDVAYIEEYSVDFIAKNSENIVQGYFITPGHTGLQSIIGVGFQPDIVYLMVSS